MNTADFFRLVLPANGVYYAIEQRTRGMKHIPCHSVENLAAEVAKIDAKGGTAYFACAAYKQDTAPSDKTKYRIEDNQRAAKSFWLDIDVSPEKAAKGDGYETKEEAGAALAAFCRAHAIPYPLVVGSGGGLHCYWPLHEEIDVLTWKKIAGNLKQLCAAHDGSCGLRADPTRTADFSSILRPVGTTNRKDPANPRPVKLGRVAASIPNEDFINPLNQAYIKAFGNEFNKGLDWKKHVKDPNDPLANPPAYVAAASASGIAALPSSDVPASAEAVANHCQQVRACRDSKGASVNYKHWFDVLGIVKHCTEGLELAVRWSEGRVEGTHTNTVNDAPFKYESWNSGPATCERFEADNPGGCKGCPHQGRIKSPIVLGFEAKAAAVAPEAVAPEAVAPAAPVTAPAPRAVVAHETNLSKWQWVGNSLCRFTPAKGDEPAGWEPFTNTFFKAVANVEDIHGGMHAGFQSWTNNGVKTAVVVGSIAGTGGAELVGWLSEKLGVIMNDNPKAQRLAHSYLKDQIEYIRGKAKAQLTYDSFGWKFDKTGKRIGFLIGDDFFAMDGSEHRSLLCGSAATLDKHFTARGSQAEWTRAVNAIYNRPGMEPYQYAICSMLGSVLTPFCDEDYSGIPMALTSSDTSKGKSTAGWTGMSCFGWPKNLLVNGKDGYTTLAGVEKTATFQHMPMLFDEMTDVKPEDLGILLYCLSNGKARDRLTMKSGDAVLNESKTWKLQSLITANTDMTAAVASLRGNTLAQAVRLIEIDVNIPTAPDLPKSEITELTAAIWHNCGHTGRALVKHVIAHEASVQAMMDSLASKLGDKSILSNSAYRFYREHFRTTIVTATLCKKLGLFDFDVQALVTWSVNMFNTRVANVKDMNTLPPSTAFDTLVIDLMERIIATDDYRLDGDGRGKELVNPVRGGIAGRLIRGGSGKDPESIALAGRLMLSTRAMRDWCAKAQIAPKEIIAELTRLGVFGGEKTFLLGRGTTLLSAREKVYEINYAKFMEIDKAAPRFSVVKPITGTKTA